MDQNHTALHAGGGGPHTHTHTHAHTHTHTHTHTHQPRACWLSHIPPVISRPTHPPNLMRACRLSPTPTHLTHPSSACPLLPPVCVHAGYCGRCQGCGCEQPRLPPWNIGGRDHQGEGVVVVCSHPPRGIGGRDHQGEGGGRCALCVCV